LDCLIAILFLFVSSIVGITLGIGINQLLVLYTGDSQDWIAGCVILPVCWLAAVIGGAFWLDRVLKRRKTVRRGFPVISTEVPVPLRDPTEKVLYWDKSGVEVFKRRGKFYVRCAGAAAEKLIAEKEISEDEAQRIEEGDADALRRALGHDF
jgi:hypothetical protein